MIFACNIFFCLVLFSKFTVILFVEIFHRLGAIFFLEMLKHIERKLFLDGKPVDSSLPQ